MPNIRCGFRATRNTRLHALGLRPYGAVLKPLNTKLGQLCFSARSVAGDQVSVALDPRCAEPGVLSRLETNPPVGLYGAPPGRQRTVVKDPGLLRKLAI